MIRKLKKINGSTRKVLTIHPLNHPGADTDMMSVSKKGVGALI
jgi:hypothetical protein